MFSTTRNGHRARALGALLLGTWVGTVAAGEPHPQWTLYAPFIGGQNTSTFLLDLDGDVVHTWPSNFTPGASVYLMDDGALLRTCNDMSVSPIDGPGRGGRLQRIGWDGTVEWDYVAGGEDFIQHHDVEILPNGNILAVVWERYSRAEAIAAGRNPALVGDEVWSEAVLEIRPDGPTGGEVVWSWHAWDILVQDFDAARPNFGDPADFPDRIDVNFAATSATADWLHFNAIDYNETLDQIVVSCLTFNEIWVISHAPEDSSELLYRWGNPQAYGRGTAIDQQLYGQHDPEWIPDGLPGAGHLTVFNNGTARGFASIDEIATPLNPDGTYHIEAGQPYGPTVPTWTCDEIDGQPFTATIMCGVQRLPNGNSLLCLATGGNFIEVDDTCSAVWNFDANGLVFRATRIDERDPRLAGRLFGLPGDMNCDGTVSVGDINAFVLALTDPVAYAAQFPDCDILNGDFNDDGALTVGDINGFVAALAG